MSNLKALINHLPQVGTLESISIRPKKWVDLTMLERVALSVDDGLAGDHYSKKGGKRQVTIIQKEHLAAVASMLGKESIDAKLTRRNLVVSGLNLLALKDKQFKIGAEVILEMTGLCHPCSRMEKNFGDGGYNAMRGHGGITCRVIQGGTIRKGDAVQKMPESQLTLSLQTKDE